MSTNHGFSLMEVLVSLLLITSTSLTLLKQQWQIGQLFNQVHSHAIVSLQMDNAAERVLSGFQES